MNVVSKVVPVSSDTARRSTVSREALRRMLSKFEMRAATSRDAVPNAWVGVSRGHGAGFHGSGGMDAVPDARTAVSRGRPAIRPPVARGR